MMTESKVHFGFMLASMRCISGNDDRRDTEFSGIVAMYILPYLAQTLPPCWCSTFFPSPDTLIKAVVMGEGMPIIVFFALTSCILARLTVCFSFSRSSKT